MFCSLHYIFKANSYLPLNNASCSENKEICCVCFHRYWWMHHLPWHLWTRHMLQHTRQLYLCLSSRVHADKWWKQLYGWVLLIITQHYLIQNVAPWQIIILLSYFSLRKDCKGYANQNFHLQFNTSGWGFSIVVVIGIISHPCFKFMAFNFKGFHLWNNVLITVILLAIIWSWMNVTPGNSQGIKLFGKLALQISS